MPSGSCPTSAPYLTGTGRLRDSGETNVNKNKKVKIILSSVLGISVARKIEFYHFGLSSICDSHRLEFFYKPENLLALVTI